MGPLIQDGRVSSARYASYICKRVYDQMLEVSQILHSRWRVPFCSILVCSQRQSSARTGVMAADPPRGIYLQYHDIVLFDVISNGDCLVISASNMTMQLSSDISGCMMYLQGNCRKSMPSSHDATPNFINLNSHHQWQRHQTINTLDQTLLIHKFDSISILPTQWIVCMATHLVFYPAIQPAASHFTHFSALALMPHFYWRKKSSLLLCTDQKCFVLSRLQLWH